MKKYFVIGGIALFFLIVMKAVFMQVGTVTTNTSNTSFELSTSTLVWIAILLLIALAAGGLIGRGGKTGSFVANLLVGGAIALIGGFVLFGADFPSVWKQFQEENVAAAKGERKAKEPAPSTSTSRGGAPVVSAREYFGEPKTIPVNTNKDWSYWVRGSGDRCVWISDVTPDQVQVKMNDASEPLDWNDYRGRKKRGEVGDFEFFRVRSNGYMTLITYEWRPRGMCS